MLHDKGTERGRQSAYGGRSGLRGGEELASYYIYEDTKTEKGAIHSSKVYLVSSYPRLAQMSWEMKTIPEGGGLCEYITGHDNIHKANGEERLREDIRHVVPR